MKHHKQAAKGKDKELKACKIRACKLKAEYAKVKESKVTCNQTVEGNLFVNGTIVTNNETVKGNLTVAGTTLLKDTIINGNETVSGNLSVAGSTTLKDVVVSGSTTLQGVTSDNITSNIITTNTFMTDSEYVNHSDISDFKKFDNQRWLTSDYDRFKQGALPKLTQVFGTNTYEYKNLTHLALPEQGNAWSAIVRGFINFNTATDSEKLHFYAGATNRLYRLMINRAWSANEDEVKIGFLQGWNNWAGGTLFQPAIPTDQQHFARDALQQILNGFGTIDVNNLSPAEATNYYNHITICKVYIEAWGIGDFDTSNMGNEYVYVPNKHMRSNYCWLFNNLPPLINFSFVVAAGINSDPGYLITWARALSILFTYFENVIDANIQAGIDGLKLGFYPHILRVNPYDSKGKSTLGSPTAFTQYGQTIDYEQYIKDAVANGVLAITDNSLTNAKQDFDLVDKSFEENLSDDILFGFNTIGGTNPQYLIDLVVEAGLMSLAEGAAIMAFCKDKYYSSVMPAMKRFLNAYYFDESSPMVRALRLTQSDDFGGEWGTKFLVTNGLVKGLTKVGANNVLIDALADPAGVIVYDSSMNVLPITMADIDLQRDEVYGDAYYKANIQQILGLSSDSPIPQFILQDPSQPYDPSTNPYVVDFITDPSLSIVDKIHRSGVGMVQYFADSINYNLNLWSMQKYGVPWNVQFPDQDSAIAELKFDDRYIFDLEDPAKGGTACFLQHYQPKSDSLGPLYDYAVLRSYYTNDAKNVPQLKLTGTGRVDGPVLKDRDGNVLYDPEAAAGPDGFLNVEALYNASQVDRDLQNYWRVMGSIDIANGKSTRYQYFNFDFAQRAYKSYITGGVDPTPDPVLGHFFSPYIKSTFDKRMGTKYLQTTTASASNFDPNSGLITYINYLDVGDVRDDQQGGRRSTFVHEWLMGHSMQQPLIQMISSLGTQPWTANAFMNGAVAEGWAVFVETFFCATYTTYLSATDHYFNYLSNDGKADPKAVVSQLLNASRVAARLKWDTAYHSIIIDPVTSLPVKTSLADFFRGFKADTFGTFNVNTEVAQRIPVCPGQGLNYALAFCTLVGLFQRFPNPYVVGDPNRGIGSAKFAALQANGNKVFKYFFDFVLIDTVGAFLGSIGPAFDSLIDKIANNVPPFDDPNYDGYPVGAFPVTTNAYVLGSNPAVYEYTADPFVPGGYNFVFPSSAIPV